MSFISASVQTRGGWEPAHGGTDHTTVTSTHAHAAANNASPVPSLPFLLFPFLSSHAAPRPFTFPDFFFRTDLPFTCPYPSIPSLSLSPPPQLGSSQFLLFLNLFFPHLSPPHPSISSHSFPSVNTLAYLLLVSHPLLTFPHSHLLTLPSRTFILLPSLPSIHLQSLTSTSDFPHTPPHATFSPLSSFSLLSSRSFPPFPNTTLPFVNFIAKPSHFLHFHRYINILL